MRFIPFVGETQAHLRDHAAWAFERVWRHGPVFRSSLYGMKDIVVATDFASIEKVMSNEHVLTEWFQVRKEERTEREKRERREKLDVAPRDLAKRQSFFLNLKKKRSIPQPASFQRLLGTASSASVMADKQRHSRQRRHQAKAFSPAALASYAPRVARETEAAVALWASKCESASPPPPLDLGEALSDLTWAYALATVVDVALDAAESGRVRAAWTAFTSNLFSAPLDFPGSRFRAALKARETLAAALGRAVREYKAAFEGERESEGGGGGEGDGSSSEQLPTMMSIYVRARADDGDPLGEEELVDMSIGLLLAG